MATNILIIQFYLTEGSYSYCAGLRRGYQYKQVTYLLFHEDNNLANLIKT